MAVAATVEKIPKSEPDVTKLNTFTGHTVTVTKHTQPRGSVGQTVVPTTEMPLKQILSLVTQLPLQHGPGFYRFTVADTGGTGDDVWLSRLGPDTGPAQQQDGGFSTMAIQSDQSPAPSGPGVQALGRGYFYNADLRVLTTPWGTAVNWGPGESLPTPPTSAAGLASVPQNATPWNWPGQQGGWQQGGWGIPINDSSDSKQVARLEAELAEQRRKSEMDNLRGEMRRMQDDTNKTIAALVDKLTSAFTAKPTGPSDEMLAMQRRLDEAERRNQEIERQRREDQREAQHRTEMQAMNDKFDRALRELATPKTDPMLPMLLQLIQSQQSAASEAVKAIQASTQTGTAAAERATQQMMTQLSGSVMNPLQLVQLMQSAKGDAAEGAKAVIESVKESMAIQRDVFTQLLETAGSGNQSPWVSLAQTAVERISAVGAALAERNAQSQQQAQAPQMRPVRRQVPIQQQAPAAGQMNGVPTNGVSHLPPVPATPISNTRPEGAAYDKATDEFVLLDGRRFWQPYIGREGWAHALGLPAPTVAREIAELRATMTEPVQTPAAAVVQPVVQAPVATVTPLKPKGRRGGKKAAPVPQTKDEVAEAIMEMRDSSAEDVFAVLQPFDDMALFGELLMPYVTQLREANPPVAPEGVATLVLEARARIQGAGMEVPLALAVLEANQIEVLVERLLPDATEEYGDAVIRAIGNALESEDNPPEDDGAELVGQ